MDQCITYSKLDKRHPNYYVSLRQIMAYPFPVYILNIDKTKHFFLHGRRNLTSV